MVLNQVILDGGGLSVGVAVIETAAERDGWGASTHSRWSALIPVELGRLLVLVAPSGATPRAASIGRCCN
jgi:hypothetical protein